VNVLAARHRATLLLTGAAGAAWVVTIERMRGMDAGPGTDLGGLGWFLGIWVTMTAAMMLPSAVPAARHVVQVARSAPTVLFAVGYLAAWTCYGLAAYGIFRLATSVDPGWLAWNEAGPYVAGGLIVAAGIYELTPLKQRSLRRCRNAAESEGALRGGFLHGRDCIGSSGGLMVVLFVLGVMSLFWMAAVAAAIFAEKVLPGGVQLSRALAAALVALGIWVAVAPASVPALTEPSESPAMGMQP
jgi:predicted metal-binding membrane protein